MKKLYETMRPGENLSWCAPYINEDGSKAISINEGVLISAIGIDGAERLTDWDEIEELIEKEELHETGCANCPWRDECDCMYVKED